MRVIKGDTKSFDYSSNDASILGLTSTNDMSYILNSLKGGYIGDYIGD